MKSRIWPRALAGVAGLAVVGAVVVAVFWEPRQAEPAPDVAADTIAADELGRAAGRTVFFGHMSVGNNILSGLEQVYAAKGVALPPVIEVDPGEDAAPPSGGAVVHSLLHDNGYPLRKLATYDAALRDGMADRVEVALLKFCYLDVTRDTDVDALFASYKATMDALQRDYPDVRFLHATVPLTTPPSGIKANLKALLRGVDNPNRERYNELVRATYGQEDLLDVAAVEGAAPDGTRQPWLHPGYSNDGSHLNGTGSALVAVELIRLLAEPGAA